MKNEEKKHESYGMVSIGKFHSNDAQFFGSDLVHNGGICLTISTGSKVRNLKSDWHHAEKQIIRVEMSHNQYVDMITSGMNTVGVPCTIKRINGKMIPQIDHIEDKKELFSSEMVDTHKKFQNQIDEIQELLNGKLGKRNVDEIKHQLKILKSHISSNVNFTMECFKEEMEKTVTEAKQNISGYIDHKIHSLGLQGMEKELQFSLESKNKQ